MQIGSMLPNLMHLPTLTLHISKHYYPIERIIHDTRINNMLHKTWSIMLYFSDYVNYKSKSDITTNSTTWSQLCHITTREWWNHGPIILFLLLTTRHIGKLWQK